VNEMEPTPAESQSAAKAADAGVVKGFLSGAIVFWLAFLSFHAAFLYCSREWLREFKRSTQELFVSAQIKADEAAWQIIFQYMDDVMKVPPSDSVNIREKAREAKKKALEQAEREAAFLTGQLESSEPRLQRIRQSRDAAFIGLWIAGVGCATLAGLWVFSRGRACSVSNRGTVWRVVASLAVVEAAFAFTFSFDKWACSRHGLPFVTTVLAFSLVATAAVWGCLGLISPRVPAAEPNQP